MVPALPARGLVLLPLALSLGPLARCQLLTSKTFPVGASMEEELMHGQLKSPCLGLGSLVDELAALSSPSCHRAYTGTSTSAASPSESPVPTAKAPRRLCCPSHSQCPSHQLHLRVGWSVEALGWKRVGTSIPQTPSPAHLLVWGHSVDSGAALAQTSQVPVFLGCGSGTWSLRASPSCTDRWALRWASWGWGWP